MNFRLINRETWERNEYFEHYYSAVPCSYSMTVKIDITKQIKAKEQLYPMMLYYLATVINNHEEFRTCFNSDGELGIYDKLVPCYTVFHKDTETFSTIWTEGAADYEAFYKQYQQDIKLYGAAKRFEAKPNTPTNAFNVSMIPWEAFDGFNLNLPNGNDYLLPIFTIGKFHDENGKYLLPLAIQVHHAVCDGFHICRFINELRTLVEKNDVLRNETNDIGGSEEDTGVIRAMQKEDINTAAEIWLNSNIKTHSFISEDYWKSHFDSVKELFSQAEVYVYEDKNKNEILGFVGMSDNYIEGIFVKEKAQSCGIGKQLLDYVKAMKKQLTLSVYQKNTRAMKFYQRERFEISENSTDLNTGEKEYVMEWKQ